MFLTFSIFTCVIYHRGCLSCLVSCGSKSVSSGVMSCDVVKTKIGKMGFSSQQIARIKIKIAQKNLTCKQGKRKNIALRFKISQSSCASMFPLLDVSLSVHVSLVVRLCLPFLMCHEIKTSISESVDLQIVISANIYKFPLTHL